MSYEAEPSEVERPELDVLAAWEVYAMVIVGFTIYSFVSFLR